MLINLLKRKKRKRKQKEEKKRKEKGKKTARGKKDAIALHACNTQVETRKEKKRKQRKIKKSKKTEKKIGKKTSKKKKKEKYTTFAWVQYLGYYRRTITSYRVRDRLLEIYLAKLNHTCGLIDTKTSPTKLSNWAK